MYSYTVSYEKDRTNYLAELCDKYGSDKSSLKETGHPWKWKPHTYADFLHPRLQFCRPHVRRVFECGLGTNNPDLPSTMGELGKPGASLRVWRDYFPNAKIFGADIDRTILFEDERIMTFYVDQRMPKSVRDMWSVISEANFDLMIDDGLHEFDAGICLFENSIERLSPSGYYIIEDILPKDMPSYQRYFSRRKYKVEYVALPPPVREMTDNNLIVIRA